MKNLIATFCILGISFSGLSQNLSDLQHETAGAINIYHSHEVKGAPLILGALTDKAKQYNDMVLVSMEMKVNLLVLNPDDWKKFTSPQILYGMPHWRRTDNALIVASDDNFFWRAHLPNPALLQSADSEQFTKAFGTADGSFSARPFFDMATTHELFHLRLFTGGIETQRIWLEEVFCNLASIAFVTKNQPELLKANDLLTNYHLQTNKAMLKYTSLETFEENRMKIVMEAPQNYGWYQFRFIDAANKLFYEGGEEVLKKLWNFLGEEKEKLSDEALKVKLSTEVHPYFKELIENR